MSQALSKLRAYVLILISLPASALAQVAPAATPTPLPLPSTPVFSSKDWRLEERTSVESAVGLCVASTTAVYSGISHHLELVIDKSGARPLEIRIRPDYETAPTTLGFKAALDRKATQVYSFAPLASADAGKEIFWNVPRGTADVVSYLKREMRFDVETLQSPAPAPTPLPNGKMPAAEKPLAFSLRGSSATINELQKRCNLNKELGSDGFERAFLPAVVATVDPAKLTARDTAVLRDLISTALVAFKTSAQTQNDLNALTARYLTQINEFEQLKRNMDRLTNQEIVRLQQRRAASQSAIDTANAELPGLRASVGARESELASANHDYEVAYNILAPLLPQIRSLQSAIDSAESALAQANSQLTTARNYQAQTESYLQQSINGIAQSEREVAALQYQLDGLRPELQRAQGQADFARRELANAESRRRGYNRDQEVRTRLQRDSRYSQAENRERDVRNQLGPANQAKSSAEQTLRAAEQNKRQAQQNKQSAEQSKRQAQQAKQAAERNQAAAMERVSQANQDYGNCTIRQSPGHPVDCSPLEAKIKEAKRDYSQATQAVAQAEQSIVQADQVLSQADQAIAQADQAVRAAEPAARQAADRVRSLENDLASAEREMQSIRSNIERDVDGEVARLVRDEQEAASRVREAEGNANRIERRMRDIASVEIPNAQNEVNKWRASRSQAESDLRTAQADVSRAEGYVRDASADLSTAQSRMSSYKSANGYREKKDEVDRTLARVNSLKSELARLDREIAKREKSIRDETAALVEIEKQMQAIVETIRQKEARSQEVQKILEPYYTERNALVQKKMVADQTFADAQAQFARSLPQ